MELWEALSNRRKEIGMSFDELQSKTNLSISTIKKILGGHVAAPSFESVRTIAYAMDITLAELDGRIDDSPSPKSAYSPEALALAEVYDKLDPHSKRVVDTVAKIEAERVPVDLPKGITPIGAIQMQRVPLVGKLVCDGSVETKHAAKEELTEMRSSEPLPVE